MKRGSSVGIIANPASARDIRRLVAHGAAVTTNDKITILRRVLAGLASTDVTHVLSMTDLAGISAGLWALADKPSAACWPKLEFVDQVVEQTAADTVAATEAMVAAGVGAIVVLGGDGTNRIVASVCDDIPLVSISTGTNNAFARRIEPTVAGIAAGLVATGRVDVGAVVSRAKVLTVESGSRSERALVDVAVIDGDVVGAGAVWDPATISQLFLCFAEPDAIGLSSIGGQVCPTDRFDPAGLVVDIGRPAVRTLRAPIAPGLVVGVDVASVSTLAPGQAVVVRASSGVVALDGERLFRFGRHDRPIVTLGSDGPLELDVRETLAQAARTGVMSVPGRRCA